MRVTLAKNWNLYTSHPAGSAGPVLVRKSDSEAFGPGDAVTIAADIGPESAAAAVARLAKRLDLAVEEERIVRRFINGRGRMARTADRQIRS